MAQAELRIDALPEAPIDASAAFHCTHLERARERLSTGADALVIVLPYAPTDHDDWRRALARDLARAHAPQRANVIGGGSPPEALAAMLEYLRDAPGITGQYLPLHEQD